MPHHDVVVRKGMLPALLAGVMLVNGCASGSDASRPAASIPPPSAPATSERTRTTATVSPARPATTTRPATAAPATSRPSTTTSTTTLPAAPLVPLAVCTNTSTGGTVFAYENGAEQPVAVPAGPDNLVALADPLLAPRSDPLAPTVFAPGRVSPVLLLDGPGSWTLRGPDGVVRTASSADAPACTPELVQPTTPDTRSASLTVAFALPDGAPDPPTTVDLVATVEGLAALSVCPPGLEPLEPLVWFEQTGATPLTVGTVLRAPLALGIAPDPVTNDAGLAGGVILSAWVVDRCGGAGAVGRTWPASGGLAFGLSAAVCVRYRAGTVVPCEPLDPVEPTSVPVPGAVRPLPLTVPPDG